MKRSIFLLLVMAVATFGSATSARSFDRDFEERLRAAIAVGALDATRADLYRLFQLRAPEHLPVILRADPVAERIGRSSPAPRGAGGRQWDGTGQMRLVRRRLESAPTAVRALAAPYLAVAGSGGGPSAAARVAGKTGSKILQNRVITENFSVEWGPELTNEMGVPWTDTAPDFLGDPAAGGNGVPDVVERWAAYLEASFTGVVTELGYSHADLNAKLVPVYLGNSDPATLIDDINTTQFFAFTEPGTSVPYLVVNNNFHALTGLTDPVSLQQLMKVTAAHEFFHVLHFLYEPSIGRQFYEDEFWWWEASATWMEDEVFDSVNDYLVWLRSSGGWVEYVESGLAPNLNDADYAPRAYGAVILAKYLSEHVGGRDSMRQVWNRIRPGGTTASGMRVLDALDDYATNRGFDGFGELFLGFAGANAVMDYEEGEDYGQVPLRSSTLTAAGLQVPEYLGATYLARPSGSGAGLQVAMTGSPATTWGLAGVLVRDAGFSLTVADRSAVGISVVRLADVSLTDSAYAIPCLLTETGPLAYASTESAFASSDTTPPGTVAAAVPVSQTGGFDLTWTAPADGDVAGYVVRWRSIGAGSYGASRTLFGEATGVEIRGLDAGTFEIQVFAYDQVGNADLSALPQAVTVTMAGGDTPVPSSGDTIPNGLISAVELGAFGGSGSGSGGCFLRGLGR